MLLTCMLFLLGISIGLQGTLSGNSTSLTPLITTNAILKRYKKQAANPAPGSVDVRDLNTTCQSQCAPQFSEYALNNMDQTSVCYDDDAYFDPSIKRCVCSFTTYKYQSFLSCKVTDETLQCTIDEDCNFANAFCSAGKCYCKPGTCKSAFDEKCVTGLNCLDSNTRCFDMKCTCVGKYNPVMPDCEVNEIYGPCSNYSDCGRADLNCDGVNCICTENMLCKLKYGDFCESDDQCSTLSGPMLCHPKNKTCTCKEGFVETGEVCLKEEHLVSEIVVYIAVTIATITLIGTLSFLCVVGSKYLKTLNVEDDYVRSKRQSTRASLRQAEGMEDQLSRTPYYMRAGTSRVIRLRPDLLQQNDRKSICPSLNCFSDSQVTRMETAMLRDRKLSARPVNTKYGTAGDRLALGRQGRAPVTTLTEQLAMERESRGLCFRIRAWFTSAVVETPQARRHGAPVQIIGLNRTNEIPRTRKSVHVFMGPSA